DGGLGVGRQHEARERLRALGVDLRPLLRVDRNDVVDVQEARISLRQDVEVQGALAGQVGRAISQRVRLLVAGDGQDGAHALTGFEVPRLALRIEANRLPDLELQLFGARVV